ncbi:hypothetical protein AB0J86_38360 [Micromonospora sp. NPDC049559]|uniref:hypothetical protein n=1 Tax=Micromonospora sp. NPDC049559 TaxID=3155923 RepID=UPI00343D4601
MSTQTPSRNAPSTQQQDAGSMTGQIRSDGGASTRQMPQSRNMGMSNVPSGAYQPMDPDLARERSAHNETKPAWRSTEFWIYLAAVGGVLIASEIVGRNSVGVDIFRADNAWLLITLLTIGYVVSRGLAKAGSSWRHARDNR